MSRFIALGSTAVFMLLLSANDAAAQMGGSNYLYFNISNCSGEPYGVVANYDTQRATIDGQLSAMYSGNGQIQSILRIPIFHQHGVNTGTVMDSALLMQGARYWVNLRDLLSSMKRIGFGGVEISFHPEGANNPFNWSVWNQSLYDENFRVIAAVRSAAIASGLTYWLDLLNEGITGPYDPPLVPQYSRRIWADYSASYWKADTVGISAQYGKMDFLSSIYQGNNPFYQDLHLYGDQGSLSSQLDVALVSLGGQNIQSQWFIGETFYNDPNNALSARGWINANGGQQTVAALIQWPLKRYGQGCSQYPDPDTIPGSFSEYNSQGFR